MSTNRSSLLVALLLLAVAALGLSSWRAPFLLDDLDELGFVRSLPGAASLLGPDCYQLFRPVKNLLFAAAAHGPLPVAAAARLLSAALLVLTTWLVFRWLGLWYEDRRWRAAGAALWAFAPTLVSSHAWFSCANILLSTAGVLAALLLWDCSRAALDRGDTRAAARAGCGCLLTFVFAFLSYEAAIVAPALAVLQDLARGRPARSRRAIAGYLIFFTAAAAVYALRSALTNAATPHNPGFGPLSDAELLSASAFFLVDHLRSWLLPFGRQEILGAYLHVESASRITLALSWTTVVAAGAAGLWLIQRAPRAGFGLLWALGALLPMCNVLPLRTGPFADYYLTLPSVGLVLLLLEIFRASGRTVRVAVIIWRSAAAGLALLWTQTWNDPAALYTASMRARPMAFRAAANLARLHLQAGRNDQAERLAMEACVLAPWYVLPYHVLGELKSGVGEPAAARDWYRKAIDAGVADAYTRYALAYVLENGLQYPAAARAEYEALLVPGARHPYREDAYLNLGRLLDTGGDPAAAIALLERAAQELPRSPDVLNNLAVALLRAGRKEEAAARHVAAQQLRRQ